MKRDTVKEQNRTFSEPLNSRGCEQQKGKGNNPTDEGILLLDDMELWWEKQNLSWVCHNSRKKDRMNEDGTCLPHQKGTISSTCTNDRCLRKEENWDKLGECLKKTTVRSQDQWRMLQAITYSFPSNYWRHKIAKAEESDRCDLCQSLWITEGRFTTPNNLPIQTLGHIQHTCETLSTIHTP